MFAKLCPLNVYKNKLDNLLFDDDFTSKCLALKLICEDRCKILMQKGISIPK